MCPGVGCPLKETCQRLEEDNSKLTKTDFFGTPWNNWLNKCKYFIKKSAQ